MCQGPLGSLAVNARAHHYNKTIRDGRGVRTDVLLGRGKYGAPYSADNTIRVSEVEVALRPQDK